MTGISLTKFQQNPEKKKKTKKTQVITGNGIWMDICTKVCLTDELNLEVDKQLCSWWHSKIDFIFQRKYDPKFHVNPLLDMPVWTNIKGKYNTCILHIIQVDISYNTDLF